MNQKREKVCTSRFKLEKSSLMQGGAPAPYALAVAVAISVSFGHPQNDNFESGRF